MNPSGPGSAPSRDAAGELDVLEGVVPEHVFALQPGYAVFLGLHQFDGAVPSLSRAATDRWARDAERLIGRVKAVRDSELPSARRLDRLLLQLLLESPLFDVRDAHEFDRNPMNFLASLSLTAYIVREYAPLPRRVEAMVRTLEAAPRLLDEARSRLRPELPEPFLRLTLSIGGGLPAHFAEAEDAAARGSSELGSRVHSARETAEAALAEFLERVKDEYLPRSTDEFALGAERFQKLLWVREGIETPAAEILRSGTADLKRNQARLEELARGRDPPLPPQELIEGLYRNHASAERLIPRAREFVEEARKFTESTGVVTIPDRASCRVEETPTYGRALTTASMNPPGPFDTAGDEGIYFVTPVDPAWAPEKQEEWLRSLNDAMLRNVTIHEVYPGHYLQFLHFRRSGNSRARKVYLSPSFTEGWAHYCEQLAIEQGYRRGGVEAEVAQIHDALLRDCRLIVSIGLHTQGMSLAEGTAFFQREAHFESLPAEREAIRGTFNPEYFCYTLGKLAILGLRAKYLVPGANGGLRAFHDRLLSFGCPPIGALDGLFTAR